MTERSRDMSRRDLFRLFGKRRSEERDGGAPSPRDGREERAPSPPDEDGAASTAAPRARPKRVTAPGEPTFAPPDAEEMENARRAARALLGDVPPPRDQERSEPSLFWMSAARRRQR